MAVIVSVFNNKGGVGKSTICWNLSHALAGLEKRVLLLDFDPQCNLSIAVLGEEKFLDNLPKQNLPYGTTIRSYLQRFLQNTGGEQVFLQTGKFTHKNVHLIAGDFWLNVYADSLNVGNDLLAGSGVSRYVALRKIVEAAEKEAGSDYDFVLIDLPPSFGALVRAAFYSSDYYIVPCTSDNFSVYCVGLIGQMVPSFLNDWETGYARFKGTNPHFTDFDGLGRPVFSGWIFNGFDTASKRRTKAQMAAGVSPREKEMVRADKTMHDHVAKAVQKDLVSVLRSSIKTHDPIAEGLPEDFQIGDIEDANVLIQNSLWLNVPIVELKNHSQVVNLQARSNWAPNQLEQINLIGRKFGDTAEHIVRVCV